MKEHLTRRQLAWAAAGSAAAVSLASALYAQSPPADPELEKARESHRQNSETLAKFDIAMSVEPAFQFKA